MITRTYIVALLSLCTFAAAAQQTPDLSLPSGAGVPESAVADSPKTVLTLEECRTRALSDNTYMRNARLDLRAAALQEREALWEYFPRISAIAAGYKSDKPLVEVSAEDILGENSKVLVESMASMYGINTSFSGFNDGYMTAVRAVQPVFAGARIVNGNRLATLGLQAARLRLDIQDRKTASEVEDLWWRVFSLEEKLHTLDFQQSVLDTLCANLSSAVEAGLAEETATLQLELKKNELAAGRRQVESSARLVKMNLLNSIGMDYSVTRAGASGGCPYLDDIRLDADSPLPESPESYWRDPEAVLMQMDEIQLLVLNVKAKRLEKKMAIGEALPQVALGVTAGYFDLNDSGKSNALAFATVQIPLSDWGKTASKAQRLEIQVQKAENERAYLQRQLRLQLDRLWVDLTSAYDRWQLSEQALLTSRRLYDAALSNYAAGLVPLQELLEAESTLRTDSSDRCDRLIEYRTAVREYLAL